MTCRELTELLMSYLDGDLGARKRRAFEDHLTECDDCVAYVESYRETVALGKAAFDDLEDAASSPVPEELVEAILAARVAKRRG